MIPTHFFDIEYMYVVEILTLSHGGAPISGAQACFEVEVWIVNVVVLRALVPITCTQCEGSKARPTITITTEPLNSRHVILRDRSLPYRLSQPTKYDQTALPRVGC